tara:strand:- start:70 stop:543 length:474 start_codon:yes stop_codon:yes gene_type:complete
MSNCKTYSLEQVHRFYDGEMNPADAAGFEAHLGECPVCQISLDGLANVSCALRLAYSRETPRPRTTPMVWRARAQQLQRSRRIAWNLVAAASVLLVTSFMLVGYSQFGTGGNTAVMTRWEENVVTSPLVDEEYADLSARTLVAIHVQESLLSEYGHE